MTTPTTKANVYEFSALLTVDTLPKDAFVERHFVERVIAPDVESALSKFISMIPVSIPVRIYESGKGIYDGPDRAKVIGRSIKECRVVAREVTL